MLSSLTRNALSMENIKHQLDPAFFNKVVDCFKHLKESKASLETYNKETIAAIKESKIQDVTKQYTNITVNLTVKDEYGYNAAVIPPRIDKNHPLVNVYRREVFDNQDFYRVKRKTERSVGKVDLDKGTVSGIFAEITSEIFVSQKIIKDKRFTAEQAASLYLHEIGHVMTFYIYLGQTVLVTHVLGNLKRRLNDAEVSEQRVEIMKEVRNDLDLDSISDDDLTNLKGDVAIQTLFLSAMVNNTRNSDTGNPMIDTITAEALADQYVTRLGGGRILATTLDRMNRYAGADEYVSNMGYLFRSIISIVAFIFFTVASAGLLLVLSVYIIGFSVPFDEYDTLPQRINRIRNDIVDRMKDRNLSKDQRLVLKDDLEQVDAIQKEMKEREGVFLSIWFAVNPKARRQRKHMKYIHQLEDLANNDLFAVSNKLQSMS